MPCMAVTFVTLVSNGLKWCPASAGNGEGVRPLLWPTYNTQHETDHCGDAHLPRGRWLSEIISPETVAGRGVEKRRIRPGVRGSGNKAKVFRGDRDDLHAWRCGPT